MRTTSATEVLVALGHTPDDVVDPRAAVAETAQRNDRLHALVVVLLHELARLRHQRHTDITRIRQAISGLQVQETGALWNFGEIARHQGHDCMSMDPAGGQNCVSREHHRAYTCVLGLPELQMHDQPAH